MVDPFRVVYRFLPRPPVDFIYG